MKHSEYFAPTSKEAPKDAELRSHQLLVRSGMIRQVSTGLYNILPLGTRVLKKIKRVIRQECDAIGALELEMPVTIPKELWSLSGRWDIYGKELLRFKDRQNRDYCFGPTHEEVVTHLVSQEIFSYKQLPLTLYQIQTKFRDEIRPRYGLMRAREFCMKDAYSFHTNEVCLTKVFNAFKMAYERIFKRLGLEVLSVHADSGNIGGSHSIEFMVPSEVGENQLVRCESCHYAANVEVAACLKLDKSVSLNKNLDLELIETPQKTRVKDVAAFLNININSILKTRGFKTSSGQFVIACTVGERKINELKLSKLMANEQLIELSIEEIELFFGASAGFIGPLKAKKEARIIIDHQADENLQYCVGANKVGFHYRHVLLNRDLDNYEIADIALAQDSDVCPSCKKTYLKEMSAIELGHIFKLGTKYSESMDAQVLDNQGKSKSLNMGCYGIGVGRTMAAIVQNYSSENKISWPVCVAPFHISLLTLSKKEDALYDISKRLYNHIKTNLKLDVLWDDRKESPGRKFADADLIGSPIRIVVGKCYAEKECFDYFKMGEEKQEFSYEQLLSTLQQDLVWISQVS